MKIWVAFWYHEYDGSDVLGLFSTEEKAREYCDLEKAKKDYISTFEGWDVGVYELDHPEE